MFLALVIATYQLFSEDWICDPGKTADIELSAGLYTVQIQGAQGGRGCAGNLLSTNAFGGNGSQVTANLIIKGEYTLQIIMGESPPTDCGDINLGGFPDGGDGGKDTEWFGKDNPGGGGGSTELKIKNTNISLLIAGGGGGGSYYHVGGFGGGFGTNGGFDGDNTCSSTFASKNEKAELATNKNTNSRKGGKGQDANRIPGGGGGGGMKGGIGGIWSFSNDFCSAGYGGSSFYNETLSNEGWFLGIPTVKDGSNVDVRGGHGCYKLKKIYKCPNFCYHCLSGDKCEQCNSDAFSYKGKCYKSCSHTYTALGEGTYTHEETRQCIHCIEIFHLTLFVFSLSFRNM